MNAPSSGKHEALVLTLQGSLVDYQKQTVKPDRPDGSMIDPEEQKTSVTSYGPLGAGLGFGIGYAWDQVLFGARAELTHSDTSLPSGAEGALTQVSLLPRLEYMFNTDTTRPFIAGILGIQHTAVTSTVTVASQFGGATQAKLDDSSTRFAIGGAFGLHTFLNRSVSLDPELTLLYTSGSGTVKDATEGVSNPDSQDYSISVVRVLFSIGLSGWIDTAGEPTPPPAYEGTAAPPTAAAAAAAPVPNDEPEAKPVSADIHLPKHRRLYLQVSKDPARPSVLVRLTEQRGDDALAKCDDVAIFTNGGPIKLAVRSHGENYLTGRLPLGGLEVLVASPDSTISVCAEQWQLSDKSREAVQGFLKARRDLLAQTGETDAPEAPPAAPPAPDAPAPPPADPNAAAPPVPSGAFPAGPEVTPPAATKPAPAAPKAAAPKK